MSRPRTTWAEIDKRMAEYHAQICACRTEREAQPLIEQAGWAYQNMLDRLPFRERFGMPPSGGV